MLVGDSCFKFLKVKHKMMENNRGYVFAEVIKEGKSWGTGGGHRGYKGIKTLKRIS